jgi:hypothetical protein
MVVAVLMGIRRLVDGVGARAFHAAVVVVKGMRLS